MLTVQPKIFSNYQTFKAREYEPEDGLDFADMDEDTYVSTRNELEEQKNSFNELADSSEFKTLKKILKGGAVLTTGLLGGMATGWGAKKSIEGFAKLSKTQPVKSAKKHFGAVIDFIKDTAKLIKKKFLESDAYKMPAEYIKNGYKKFGETKFGKPVVKFLNYCAGGIKKAYTAAADLLKNFYNKIRGIKKETWEKGTVNTVGVSGGIASGVNAIKEQSEEE